MTPGSGSPFQYAALCDEGRCGVGYVDDEKKRRRIRSSKPVELDAELALGFEVEIRQSPAPGENLPLPPRLSNGAGRETWPGNRARWRFQRTDRVISICRAGCANSYGIFGAPGTGKTHLMRKILRSLFDYAPDLPEKQFGGLILDPKGSMIDDVSMMLEGHPREKDLVVIDGSSDQEPRNVIQCSLRTRELARTLVLAAQSSGVTAREPFWFIAWTNLFADAMTLLEYRFARELTIGRIVESIMNIDDAGRREIEVIAAEMELNPEAWAALCARYAGHSAEEIEMEIRHAAVDIRSFYRAKQEYVATVETFIINAFGDFRSKRCAPFSPEPRSWADRTVRSNLYDSILEDGKIVVVSLPPI